MVAAYGGLTVVLSVVIRGETLTTVQAFGAAVATVGVILTGVAVRGRPARHPVRGSRASSSRSSRWSCSPPCRSSRDIALETIDWLPLMIMARGFNAILSVAILRGPGPSRRAVGRAAGRRAVVVADQDRARRSSRPGTLDVLGLISFVIGLETAPTWMVGLASSFGPAVTIIAAVAFLGERLKPIQWVGLGGILVGMIAIGLPDDLISRRRAAPGAWPLSGKARIRRRSSRCSSARSAGSSTDAIIASRCACVPTVRSQTS